MRKVLVIAVLLIIAPLAVLVLLVMTQAPRKPNISITFLGCTNGASGQREAAFRVRNFDSSAAQTWGPMICIQTPTNWVGSGAPPGTADVGLLPPGASKLVTISSPTNGMPWTIAVRADHDFGAWRVIKCLVMYTLYAMHFRPKYGNIGFLIEGEWINENR